jgi:hypothetical protein
METYEASDVSTASIDGAHCDRAGLQRSRGKTQLATGDLHNNKASSKIKLLASILAVQSAKAYEEAGHSEHA